MDTRESFWSRKTRPLEIQCAEALETDLVVQNQQKHHNRQQGCPVLIWELETIA